MYITGSWGKATQLNNVIFINNKTKISNSIGLYFYSSRNQVGFTKALQSLYSTATRNLSCWALKMVYTPNATILRYLYQHVGIQKAWQTQRKPQFTKRNPLLPNATPNASRWNIGHVGSPCVGHVHFMFLCQFHSRWVASMNSISGGIWALNFRSKYKATLIKYMVRLGRTVFISPLQSSLLISLQLNSNQKIQLYIQQMLSRTRAFNINDDGP